MRNINEKSYYLFFGNLSSPLRISIVSVLKNKSMSVTELSNFLKVEQSKLSHALSCLRRCKIVEVNQKGKKRIYSLNRKTILPILKIIDKHSKIYCRRECKYCIHK